MLFSAKQKILFIGDSITDADRHHSNVPYGAGYVNQIHNLLAARYPELELKIINHGVSGDTTKDLVRRWDADVLSVQPDWLSVKIGINDVWRGFRYAAEGPVALSEYTTILRQLLDDTRAHTTARLILMTPYVIDGNLQDPMRQEMDRYGETVKTLAREYDAPVVDTQAAFDVALAHTKPEDWAGDKIHPNGAGHAILALAFLRVVGFTL